MKYLYFPGCSLKGMGRSYDESLHEMYNALDVSLVELPDWNCCGATSYMAVDELSAFALAARNLAIAENNNGTNGSEMIDLVAPCAACFLVLNKAQRYLDEYDEVGRKVKYALNAAGLEYDGRVRVRHPLDTLVNDIGLDVIRERVGTPLKGLKVACYYGCQIVRPYADFDDQHRPMTMDLLMESLGAEVVDWPLKTRCCGGSLTGTIEGIGIRLSQILLTQAQKGGADIIATACPLCEFNLDSFQGKISAQFGQKIDIPIAYFSQLMGLAFNIPSKKLGLTRHFVSPEPVLAGFEGGSHV